MKCSGCQIALPTDVRICPKCGARQWQWLRTRVTWVAIGALAAIVLGVGSFSFGLVGWFLLILVALVAPWREWIDLPVSQPDQVKETSFANLSKQHGPVWKNPRLWPGVGLAAARFASDQFHVWLTSGAPWAHQGKQRRTSGWRAPAVVAGKTVILMNETGVQAFDAESGEERWNWKNDQIQGLPTASGDAIFVRAGNYLVSLDAASGTEQWRRPESTPSSSPAIAPGKSLHALTTGSDSNDAPKPGETRTSVRTKRRTAVRVSPVVDAEIATVLESGTTIKILEEPKLVDDTVWYPMTSGDLVGWVAAHSLDLTATS